jgi:steroid 5-alpha reductase family enzyme
MTLIGLLAITAAVVFGMMIVLWVISLILKNASIVDIFWGFGFVLVAWVAFFVTPCGYLPRKLLLLTLVTIWGLRLSIHILLRNFSKPEDFRYQKWRQENGSSWWWKSLFKVFLLQGLLMWVISTPLPTAMFSQAPKTLIWLDFAGLGVWMIGFFFEAVGDLQLTAFRRDPGNKGKVLNTSVWRYTRHPNYFGDATQWWGYYLIALAASGWWTIFSPIIMTLFLLRVSGVALIEKTLAVEKPGYREYIESTSPFIPWFPKKSRK